MSRRGAALGLVAMGLAVLLPALASAESLPPAASSDLRTESAAGSREPKHVSSAPELRDVSAHEERAATAELPSLSGTANYRALVEKEARREGLAPEIAEAVMAVESGYNPAALGGAGEIGLMQILPSTARMLGFAGTNAELAVPATNIHYGVTYLAQAWRRASGDLCTATMKYRAGHGETRFSYRSVDYCLAVRSKLTARGFRVTGSVPVATFGEAAGGGCRKRCIGVSRIGRVDLAALNTQMSALVTQVRAGR